jgi:hypothetical protein
MIRGHLFGTTATIGNTPTAIQAFERTMILTTIAAVTGRTSTVGVTAECVTTPTPSTVQTLCITPTYVVVVTLCRRQGWRWCHWVLLLCHEKLYNHRAHSHCADGCMTQTKRLQYVAHLACSTHGLVFLQYLGFIGRRCFSHPPASFASGIGRMKGTLLLSYATLQHLDYTKSFTSRSSGAFWLAWCWLDARLGAGG